MKGFGDDITDALVDLAAVDAAVNRVLPDAAEAAAKLIAEDARRRAPKQSGRLQRSIDDEAVAHKRDLATHDVVVAAYYASFVEYGTRQMAAQPYLRPAVDTNEQAAARLIEGIVFDAINKELQQ